MGGDRCVAGTLPYGNRFHLPFPRRETGLTLADLTLLLASLSDDAGRRTVEHRPALREEVERIRADPQAFVSNLRK